MSEHEDDAPDSPGREQTDQSLRVEREKSDSAAVDRELFLDEKADEVVRLARHRADQVVRSARDDADREGSAMASDSERARVRADAALDRERDEADAVLEAERAERRRYLVAFLADEREATDQDLMGERLHADEGIATRDEFLAIVTHDLRSLLGGLSLNAQLLGRHAPDGAAGDTIRKYADTSQRLLVRMNRLVSDLLDVASIDVGQLALYAERVEVANILRDTLDAFEPIAAAKRIELRAEAEALPLFARLDTDRILQVLANLVSNAIKFTPMEGKVSIGLGREGSDLRFVVSDTGIGIPEDVLHRVFERFRQVSKDRRGLGLGLYISKGIVEAHGGTIWAESKLGTGSTFHVALPCLV